MRKQVKKKNKGRHGKGGEVGDVAHTYTDNLQEDSKDKRLEAEECGTVQRHFIDRDEKYLSVKLLANWAITKI